MKKRKKKNFIPEIIIIILLILILTFSIIFCIKLKYEKEYLIIVEGLKEKADNYVLTQQYKIAEKFYKRALLYASMISMYDINKKERIVEEIKRKLSDSDFNKGLSGYILFEGKWIEQARYKEILREREKIKNEFKRFLIETKKLYLKGDYDEALKNYQIAFNFMDKYKFLNKFFNKKEIKRMVINLEKGKSSKLYILKENQP